jgi:signal transduction histidine kinase
MNGVTAMQFAPKQECKYMVQSATNPVVQTETSANILVVDDTPANLHLLVNMLRRRGYSVRPVPSGALALEVAGYEVPDIVLLDVTMPGMNGYEVCEKFKADEKLKDVPIIFISALDETNDKVKAFSVGGVDYISKPFQQEEVLARVRTHLALRRQELQLERNLMELKKMEAMRDSLVHMIVHDMRSPLSAVTMTLNFLRTSHQFHGDEIIIEMLDSAMGAARRLSDMTHEVLDISRLEAGQMPVKKEMASLVGIIKLSAESMKQLAEKRKITMDTTSSELVSCDPEIISRIVCNLLGNALKFTPPDGEIHVSLTSDEKGSTVFVKDNGPGIAPEDQQKVFDKFCQADLRHRGIGSGLGLAFCKLAVEAHGGKIGVESVLNQGSTFWFTIPKGV